MDPSQTQFHAFHKNNFQDRVQDLVQPVPEQVLGRAGGAQGRLVLFLQNLLVTLRLILKITPMSVISPIGISNLSPVLIWLIWHLL